MISLAVLAAVLVAFGLHTVLHLEPSVVALLGGLLLLALSRLDATEVAKDVEWPTLVFFAGLFVMVGGLVATGVIDTLAHAATDAVAGKLWPATMLLLWASAGLSAIVDNIPYVATMSPIVAELVDAVRWQRPRPGAVVGPRHRRRPGRQRHRDRRVRERRGARHRRTRRASRSRSGASPSTA